MCRNVPWYLLSISTKTHNHETLAAARPGSWHGRNGHGTDRHCGNTEGGGSVMAGAMGVRGVYGGCL